MKEKERHIVSWSEQEDDVLREQISIHGTDNWAMIASKFKDKTTRQCRRRWYTYLNSDFKKGGWSPEEDMLLCEAQKIFGNRWTEIAKVVSGRTDNAVKNRFTTLRKKRAKHEALAKEKAASFINQNNKRPISGMSKGSVPIKKTRRSHIPDSKEICSYGDRSIRPPFTVLVQNLPKINVADTMQQAELLSSLAVKVTTENTDPSFENAWKVVQDLLNRSKEGDIFRHMTTRTESIDPQLEDLRDSVEDLRSRNEGSQRSWRRCDLSRESPCSSEYSTGSTLLPYTTTGYRTEQTLAAIVAVHLEIVGEDTSVSECENRVFSGATINEGAEIFSFCDEQTNNDGVTSASSNEIGSPLQITPVFRSLADGIPSPKFSESERHFLLKTFGVESPSPNPSINPSQPPPCKRALLKSL